MVEHERAECPSNPWVPTTIQWEGPLGERTIATYRGHELHVLEWPSHPELDR